MVSRVEIVTIMSSSWRIPYLKGCLKALSRQQQISQGDFGVILVCMCQEGSPDIELEKNLNTFLDANDFGFDVTRIFHHMKYEDGQFPFSLARNIGARKTTSEIVAFIDADFVADPLTISTALEIVPKQRVVAYSVFYRMLQKPPHVVFDTSNLDRFRKERVKGVFEPKAKGSACIFIDRGVLFMLRGYDERLSGWGYEDDDFVNRLHRADIYLEDMMKLGIVGMHQFHEVDHRNRYHTCNANAAIARKNQEIYCNPTGWGEAD